MEVDNDDDPEIEAKVMRARAAVTEVTELPSACGSVARDKRCVKARIRRLRPSSRYCFLRRPQSLWLPRSSLRLKRKRSAESNSLQTAAVMRRRLPRAGLPRRHRIPGECNQPPVGSRPGQPLDILLNNINDWSRKAAAFFLQRRPRVALFVEHHLAASSLPREKELWERHGYRLSWSLHSQRAMAGAPREAQVSCA